MKVIIAGSRDFKDYNKLKKVCDYILSEKEEVEIISGTARGADKLGEKFARERGFKIHYFPAKWDEHGKAAGYIRNEEMAKFGDALIVFWDNKSKGTKHMINLAEKYQLKIRIIRY